MGAYTNALRFMRKTAAPAGYKDAGVGTYGENGRIRDMDDDYDEGSFGHPEQGTYGYALDARKRQLGGNPGLVTGSASLPSAFAGQTTPTIGNNELRGNRRQVAATNAQAIATSTPVGVRGAQPSAAQQQQIDWMSQQLREGGARNASSFKNTGKLPAPLDAGQFKGNQQFDSLTPEQQGQFINAYNTMAYNRPAAGYQAVYG